MADGKKEARRKAIDKEARHIAKVSEAQSRYTARDQSAKLKSARNNAKIAAKLAEDLRLTYEELIAARRPKRSPD